MSVVTEDNIRAINTDVDNKLIKVIQELEQIFRTEDAQILKEEILASALSLYELSVKIKMTNDIKEKISILTEVQTHTKEFRLKYNDFLPKNVLEDMEATELYCEALKELSKGQAMMLVGFLETENEVTRYAEFYTGLINILQVVEKYIKYMSSGLRQVLKNTALSIIADDKYQIYQAKNPNNTESIASYIIAIRNAAKAILWEIEHYKEEQPKRFKTLEELFDYMDKEFSEAEMAETLEVIKKGINAERESRGGRKMFLE